LWLKLPTQTLLVDLDQGTHETLQHFTDGPDSYEASRAMKIVQVYSPHWKFASICFDRADAILLTDSQGKTFHIRFDSSIIRLLPDTSDDSEPAQTSVVFRDFTSPLSGGYRLKMADLPNGTRAWLDSRGLLHLKAADAKLTEVTLVLRDGMLSGWIATGEGFGHAYYCGRPNSAENTDRSGREVITGRYAPNNSTPASSVAEQPVNTSQAKTGKGLKRVSAERVWMTVIQPLMRQM
jgi:hypothetical protein